MSNAPQHKPKVMLVDDNPDTMSLLAGHMSLSGIEPVKAGSAAECLEMIPQDGIQATVINGTIVLEKGGLLISRIKEHDSVIKILITIEGESDRSRLLRLGCEDSTRLPISAQTVIKRSW